MLQYFDTLTDDSGNSLLGATITVTNFVGGALATIYSTNGTANPIPTAVVAADITGQVSFYAPDGAYTLTYAYKGTTYKVRSPVQLLDPMGFVAAADSGAANALVVSSTALPAQKYVGLKLEVKVAATSTGVATLNYQNDGGNPITQPGGSALASGMLQANGFARFEWDGVEWQLVGAQSQPFYARTPAEISAGVTPVNTSLLEGHLYRYGTNTTPGTTDMTAALNAAFSLVGIDVYIPPNQTILIASNPNQPVCAQIYGAGQIASALTMGPGCTKLLSLINNIDLHDFGVVGNTTASAKGIVFGDNANLNCNAYNIYVKNLTGTGAIGIQYGQCVKCTFTRVTAFGCTVGQQSDASAMANPNTPVNSTWINCVATNSTDRNWKIITANGACRFLECDGDSATHEGWFIQPVASGIINGLVLDQCWAEANYPGSSVTVSAGSAVITGTNNFVANQPVQFSGSMGSVTGITPSTGVVYYVSSTGLSSSQFEISATPGGSVITPGGSGSATPTAYGNFQMTIDGSAAGCTLRMVLRDCRYTTGAGAAFAFQTLGANAYVTLEGIEFAAVLASNIFVQSTTGFLFVQRWQETTPYSGSVNDQSNRAWGWPGAEVWTPTITIGGGTATFTAGPTIAYASFRRITNNLTYYEISWTGTVSNTGSAPGYFSFTVPSGITLSRANQRYPANVTDNATEQGGAVTSFLGGNAILQYKLNSASYTLNTNVGGTWAGFFEN